MANFFVSDDAGLDAALASATANGAGTDNIFLTAGTYSAAHTIATSVVINGNHAGQPGDVNSPTPRGFNESVLSGGIQITAAGVTIDGVEVTGSTNFGGAIVTPTGIYITASGSGATIQNTLFDGTAGAAGLTASATGLTVTHNKFDGYDLGMYAVASAAGTVDHNTFVDQNGGGVGIQTESSSLDISLNTFQNEGTAGAAIFATPTGFVDVSTFIHADNTVYSLLPSHTVNIDVSGAGPLTIVGSAFDDAIYTADDPTHAGALTIYGLGGNDEIWGGAGNDTIDGGAGDDIFHGQGGTDTVSYDTATSAVTVDLSVTGSQDTGGAGFDTLNGDFANLAGSGFNDVLTGDGNDNIITACSGVDTINADGGNDTLVVDAGDAVAGETYNGGTGSDTLQVTGNSDFTGSSLLSIEKLLFSTFGATTATFTSGQLGGANLSVILAATGDANSNHVVVNMTGTSIDLSNWTFATWTAGTDTITINGSAVANAITGSSQNDVITGGLANDIIDGQSGDDMINYAVGDGADTIDGGANSDTLSITGTAGDDTLVALISGGVLTSMAGSAVFNVEHVTLALAGGTGDTLSYAGTTEAVTVNLSTSSSTGFDSVSGVENVTGGSAGDTLTGDANVNLLDGAGGNDTLDGGTGADTMTGGDGDDIYLVDNAGDVVTEAANQGTDEVRTSLASYTLGANVENLTGTVNTGQALTGNTLVNTITGGSGADTLDGAGGADTMAGGLGNDIYFVDNAGDVVTENANAGTDEVRTGLASYTLAANVENLTGTAATGQTLTGNSLDNLITSGTGADTMAGAAGNDTYVVNNVGDVVTENGNEGIDTIQTTLTSYSLASLSNVENLTFIGVGSFTGTGNALDNTLTGGTGADTLAGGAGNDSYIVDNAGDLVTENANGGTDTVYASIIYSLGTNVENLTLTGSADLQGYGNGLTNTLTGNGGNNLLNGGVGADIMSGGAGSDVYFVDNASDSVVENANAGNDSVFSSVSFTLGANVENLLLQGSADLQGYGNGDANAIYGNSGNNLLNGGAGIDLMAGGSGDDVYFVDDPSDAAFEAANQGNDAVFASCSYGLAADVEGLILQGSGDFQAYGNNLANTIYGNSGNNLLNAGGGIDLMAGGAGNDIYYADDSSDACFELANEGNDTVFATTSYGLAVDVENLILQGSGNFQAYGSSQANTIYGNTGNNLINGGAGADFMAGGAGDDVYYVDNASDVCFEVAGQGNDSVFATANFSLSADVDNLILQGAADLQGTGNSQANVIYGNTGNNTLDGGGAADQLAGGAGNDTFVFNAGQANGDAIVDFDGNGAAVGDALKFVGYGAGATFTNIDGTHWEVNYNGGSSHDIITFMNGPAIHPLDYTFV